jgi:adiponectin receptor
MFLLVCNVRGIPFRVLGVNFRLIKCCSYHTVMCHSQQIDMFGAQLDFQGVILLMWGATVPLVYYDFYCNSALRNAYWTLV